MGLIGKTMAQGLKIYDGARRNMNGADFPVFL